MKIKCKKKELNKILVLTLLIGILALNIQFAIAQPDAPTVTTVSNSTRTQGAGTLVNSETGDGNSSGGYIFTVNLDQTQQNNKWKAFIGNVTGKLVLDDADSISIYEWELSGTVSGEVYATRQSAIIEWGSINCTWAQVGNTSNFTDGFTIYNRTVEELENDNLFHTSINDNISATFNNTNHSSMVIGTITLPADYCWSVHTYVNNAPQELSDDTNYFQELILSDDGTDIVYATTIEDDATDYRANTSDFQMLIPENATDGFTGNTPYYFYVELS